MKMTRRKFLNVSTGSVGCDPKGFNQRRNTERYPCADQPVHPFGKAGRRRISHSRHAECGYCINDRSVLNRNADGSVDVTLSHVMPENTENWLPIGETEFHLFLRIYKPDWNALRGWQPPTVCVKSTQM